MDSKTAVEKKSKINSGFALVIISHVLNHTYDSLMPVLYPSMISEFNLSYSLVGMLSMGYRLSSGALQIIMGFLGRYMKRKILLAFGMLWQSIANSFGSISNGFEGLFVSRTLAGIGSSPQHPTGAAYITENFSRERLGRALGTNITAAQFGTFITPFIGSLLLSILGWRITILAFSIPGILVGIAFLFIAESKRSGDWKGLSSMAFLWDGLREVLHNKTVLVVMIVEMVMAFRAGARDFIPSYLVQDLTMSSLEAGVLFTVFMGSGLPAPYIWGYLSDRFERRKVLMLTMGAASVLWLLVPYSRNIIHLVLVFVPLGFVCQGVGGIVQAFVGASTSKENRDLIYGIYFTLAYTVGSLGPVILGYLADSFGFQIGFIYVALVSAFSVLAAYFLKNVSS
jgi:FSR family fosmidomycin resistance protein-like MFS transporter